MQQFLTRRLIVGPFYDSSLFLQVASFFSELGWNTESVFYSFGSCLVCRNVASNLEPLQENEPVVTEMRVLHDRICPKVFLTLLRWNNNASPL